MGFWDWISDFIFGSDDEPEKPGESFEDGGIPPIDWEPPTVDHTHEINDFSDFVEFMELSDPYAQNLLEQGWFNDEISADRRADAREAFFEYTGYEDFEFPWDEWREWYDGQ